jgi:DNA mismatch endonuclease, patch repair protein
MVASKRKKVTARFAGLHPATPKASHIAASASHKAGTKCEIRLGVALQDLGLKFTTNVASLPGSPDLVFERERVAVFADGDFWHGRNLEQRIARLSRGHNSEYWIRKIQSNVARDRRVRRQLRTLGWHVIRIWESDINSHLDRVTARIVRALHKQL